MSPSKWFSEWLALWRVSLLSATSNCGDFHSGTDRNFLQSCRTIQMPNGFQKETIFFLSWNKRETNIRKVENKISRWINVESRHHGVHGIGFWPFDGCFWGGIAFLSLRCRNFALFANPWNKAHLFGHFQHIWLNAFVNKTSSYGLPYCLCSLFSLIWVKSPELIVYTNSYWLIWKVIPKSIAIRRKNVSEKTMLLVFQNSSVLKYDNGSSQLLCC